MKLINIFVVAFVTMGVISCDEIKESERFGQEPIAFTPRKNVLIEDFTGQMCLNCPTASEAIHSIQKLYGEDHVVAVAIHGGGLKAPWGYDDPRQLATPQGDEFNEHWAIPFWPNGMVDRTGLQEYPAWSARTIERLQMNPQVDIEVSLFDDEASSIRPDSITLQIQLTGNEVCSGNLCIWIVEDGIVGLQVMPTGRPDLNYIHNHVFRTNVNNPYGDPIIITQGEQQQFEYGCVLPDHWIRENLSVVTFVWNENGGVYQVVCTKI